jgi:hypothetical protein
MFSQQLAVEDQAAVWTTSALMFSTVFCHVDASTPEEAWPLRAPSAFDLDWLKMSDGKNEIGRMTSSLKGDPVFGELVSFHVEHIVEARPIRHEFGYLPKGFTQLYNLDDESSADNNLFHSPLAQLSRVLAPGCHPVTKIMYCWAFFGGMKKEFRRLLGQKDPRALLIKLYWYAQMNEVGIWWLIRRTVLEGQAICIYLERYHGDNSDIRMLLQFPKMRFFPTRIKRFLHSSAENQP